MSNNRKGLFEFVERIFPYRRFPLFVVPFSFWKLLQAEFTRDYMLECEEQKYLEKRERIYNFLLMSSSLEKVKCFSEYPAKNHPLSLDFLIHGIQVSHFSRKQTPRGTTVVEKVNHYMQLHSSKDTHLMKRKRKL